MRKVFATIIMIIGIIIIGYPTLKGYIDKREHDELMQAYSIAMEAVEYVVYLELEDETNLDKDLSFEGEFASDLETNKPTKENKKADNTEKLVDERKARNNYIQSAWPVEAILSIKSIDLEMPIIESALPEYLDVSICSIDGSSKPWEEGNYAIAGHRSMTYGRHFNRLGELDIGQMIIIDDLSGMLYEYQVHSISIVHETDLSVLEDNGYNEVTLITCEPAGVKNPDFRLIIKAKLK